MTPNLATTTAFVANNKSIRREPNSPFVVSLSNHERADQTSKLNPRRAATIYVFGVWRSLVAHLHGVQGVVGSNPITPTNEINGLQLTRL